ncbi:hypothetical protein TPAR_05778 [Tolypocladium paradoxum]|uniref:MARVEL domain-containing protein n=1 Tax=Tolypocladium paradoxum TaxID=94208 RepID=A0A2S4KV20_9HYPO|nr:hypothetical protein TPAR_05778 [Tolypocladium paradoxum]
MGLGAGITTIIHAVLAVLLLIELGLTGYVVGQFTSVYWGISPSSFGFMLFNSIWSILVLVYLALTPRFVEKLYHSIIALALLGVTTLFWFAGSIAMAAFIGVPGACPYAFCTALRTAQAAVAFGFFIWIIFSVLTAFEGMTFLRGGARADTTNKPGQPAAAA